ncbi:hypothetical protein G2W53_024278 [Senna tora]|uniref:Uncharacterized protein n=1 Tax=Senna tora TaxID=362788 RepID=A0A834WFB7_9FABA|nr:hypothetical protein G2W53_024278 [Senna tora]
MSGKDNNQFVQFHFNLLVKSKIDQSTELVIEDNAIFVILKPPSTTRLRPLTYLDSSLPKNRAASATSSSFKTTSFIFPASKYALSTSSLPILIAFIIKGVATAYGDTQFTLIPYFPISTHRFFVRPTTACFDAEDHYFSGVFGYQETTVHVHLKNSLQLLLINEKDGGVINVSSNACVAEHYVKLPMLGDCIFNSNFNIGIT